LERTILEFFQNSNPSFSHRPVYSLKNAVLWDVAVALVRTDVSEECTVSIIRMRRIGEP
jgi:hypothetical protein